ncbi:MAG TPA: DUF6036 family nucleotidyltransferase [Chthoniobacterales bacterium]
MRLRSLIHLVEAASALGQSRKILVMGSSALLGSFPELGEAGGPLETTYDADLLPDPINSEIAGFLLESLGENSLFHEAQGYHLDVLAPEIVEALPAGWQDRLVPLNSRADCLDPCDVAAVKVRVGREKDVFVVRTLLELGKIQENALRERIASLELGERELFRTSRNLSVILRRDS